MSDYAGQSAGPSTDRHNEPVIDPTKNVLDLVAAAISGLRDAVEGGFRRQDDLRDVEAAHVREVASLRAEYQTELRAAETERINAIRAVDVQAVAQAATATETRASALAAQVAASAEAMRSQVAAAASAAATSLAAALEPVQKDIADLRRAQYEAQGQKAQGLDSRAILAAVVAVIALAVLTYGTFRGSTTTPPQVVTVTVPAATAP